MSSLLNEQPCCREHNPRHEQGRARKKQEVVQDSGHHIPLRTAPCTADVLGPAADVMGIPPTLPTTPRRFDWFPTEELFLDDYVPLRFPFPSRPPW
jgi:hypothetical protein